MTKIEQDFQNENIDSQTLIQDFFSTYPEYIEQKEIITQAWNFLLEKSKNEIKEKQEQINTLIAKENDYTKE